MRKKILKLQNSSNFGALLTNGLLASMRLLNFTLLARALSTENFGIWVIYLTTVNFMEMLRFGLLRTAFIKFTSGLAEVEQRIVEGSSWLIALVFCLLIGLLALLFHFLQPLIPLSEGFRLFFVYYPAYALLVLPYHYATFKLQAAKRFMAIFALTVTHTTSWASILIFNLFYPLSLQQLVWGHIAAISMASGLALLLGWSNVSAIPAASKAWIMKLLHFGKYSIGTLIGSNLLKSADTYLINLFLGPAATALYNIPLRLTEMLEIPLRALAQTALPKISAAANQNQKTRISELFAQYTSFASLIYLPLLSAAFIFAPQLVTLIGGEQYTGTHSIFRIFLVASVFLPADRFAGVTLDAIGLPQINLRKVVVMALVNIAGDYLVLQYSTNLSLVALVTINTLFIGMSYGLYQLIRLKIIKMAHFKAYLFKYGRRLKLSKNTP